LFYATLPIWPSYLAFACSQFLPGRRWVAALKGIAAIALAFAALQLLTIAFTRVFAPGNDFRDVPRMSASPFLNGRKAAVQASLPYVDPAVNP